MSAPAHIRDCCIFYFVLIPHYVWPCSGRLRSVLADIRHAARSRGYVRVEGWADDWPRAELEATRREWARGAAREKYD